MPNPNIKTLMLPRGYLSWSAYSTFKRSKEEFIRHYFLGEPSRFNSPSMQFGSTFAKAIEKSGDEDREEHPDPVVELAIQSIPKKANPEYKMKAVLPSKYGNINLVGTLDQYDPVTHDFDEFKTGWRKWTQGTANSHGQMKFYALMIWLNHNVTNSKKKLVWIETAKTEDGIQPTGRITSFPVEVSLPQLLKFAGEIKEAAREINELYTEFINKNV